VEEEFIEEEFIKEEFIEGGFGSSKIREVKFIVKKVNLYRLALITK
jgi:hypothetical protein